MGAFDDIVEKYAESPKESSRPSGAFDHIVSKYEQSSVLGDVAKSAGTGVLRAGAGILGLPGDVQELINAGVRKAGTAMGFTPTTNIPFDKQKGHMPTSSDVIGAAERIGVPFHEPETRAGKFAKSVGEFAPFVLGGEASALRKGASAVLGGVGSEAAGEVAQSAAPGYELPARVVGGLIGGVIPHIPSTPNRVLREALEGATAQDINAAEAAIRQAQAQGIQLSWDEALAHVTNGRVSLQNQRRFVEKSGGGEPLRAMMAERPEAVRRAAEPVINDIRGAGPAPSAANVGLNAQRAAEGDITATQGEINAATRTLYNQAATQRVGPQVQAGLIGDPLYARALEEVRNNPELNATIANLPDDSVGVIDLVQRRLRERGENAAVPGNASSSNLAAANLQASRTAPIAAAETATGSRPAMAQGMSPRVVGPYERARAEQTAMREAELNPLVNSPTGAISRTSEVGAQGEALLPKAPAANSEADVRRTVQGLMRQGPAAAEDLIHSHLQTVFNAETSGLIGQANPRGGARFAKALVGNNQAARNLEAAITTLPRGQQRWRGLSNLLDTLEATGRAPAENSATAPLQEVRRTAVEGGLKELTRPLAAFNEFAERFRLNMNAREIARLLTAPRAGGEWRRIASTRPGSAQSVDAIGRLLLRANVQREDSK
jgi:hypothetical protein